MAKSIAPSPTPLDQPPAAPAGDTTITLRAPADLAAWALVQARKEGTDRTKKIIEYLRRWKADVEAAEASTQAQRQAEIQAAVAAALKARRRSAKARRKPQLTKTAETQS
jgi:hypothetical protein